MTACTGHTCHPCTTGDHDDCDPVNECRCWDLYRLTGCNCKEHP